MNEADVNSRRSVGTVAPGFEAVRNRLDAYLLDDPAFSAQLSAYWRGEKVVDLVGGPDLDADSLTGVFSVSKGAAGLAIGLLVDEGMLDFDAPVRDYWPEFAAAGKEHITIRQLLSHQAGLVNVRGGLDVEELTDSTRAAARLAEAGPLWRPGRMFGYHGFTIGVFMEELARRVAGTSLQSVFEERIRATSDADFWLGLPETEESRFRRVLEMAPTAAQQAEIAARSASEDSIAAHAFNSIGRPARSASGGPNDRAIRASGFSSFGGIGSADGLARIYAGATGQFGAPAVSAATLREMATQQVWGVDRVLNRQMGFGVVFMKPVPGMEFGSYRSFGHDGAGGALAFADPLYDLAFGYIPMPMQYPGGADPKGVMLSQLIRQGIRQLS